MTLTANFLSTDADIAISKIYEIHEEDGILYILGKHDLKNLISEPLMIIFNRNDVLNAQRIELDSTKLCNIRLHC